MGWFWIGFSQGCSWLFASVVNTSRPDWGWESTSNLHAYLFAGICSSLAIGRATRSLPCELFLSAAITSPVTWADFPQSEWSESEQRWAAELPRQKTEMEPDETPDRSRGLSCSNYGENVLSFLLMLLVTLRPTVVHVGGQYTEVRVPGEKIFVSCHRGWLPLQIKLCAHAKCSKRGRKWLCSHRFTSPLRNFQACWFSLLFRMPVVIFRLWLP